MAVPSQRVAAITPATIIESEPFFFPMSGTNRAGRYRHLTILPAAFVAILLGSCANRSEEKDPIASAAVASLPPNPPVSISASAGPDDLVGLALERNPTLRALRNRIERLEQRAPQDRSLPDPTMELAAGRMAETASGETDAVVGFKQKFPFPGKRREAAAASTREAEAAVRDLAAMELKITEQVRSAWWDYYLSAETDRLTRESRELLEAVRASVDARVAAGQGNQGDQLRLANESGQLDKDLADARRMNSTALARLNSLLDRKAGASLPRARLTHLPSTGTLDFLLTRASVRHPEIEAATLRSIAYRHRLARAKLEKYPDVTLGITGADIDSSGLSPVANGRDQIFGTLGFNIPLWQKPRRAMIREAEAGIRETTALVGATEASLRFRVEEAWSRASASREIINLFEERLIPDAAQAHQVALVAYAAERSPFNDVIDTWRQLLAYRLQLASARSQLGKADAALRSAAALDLPSTP